MRVLNPSVSGRVRYRPCLFEQSAWPGSEYGPVTFSAWNSPFMAKAILTTKVDPTYDDLPEQRYHFPRTYLRQVEAARGDWIIYYEPRRQAAI